MIPPGGVPEVMDIKELSSYLGIGKSKIYALIRAKKIPASQIGRQYRFYKALIDKWLQEKLITGASEMPLFDQDERDKK
ncbi:MAG: helix-turn-helix domain-containing protein [Elusimicrobia bacterium]|nr:helix-turn-helix domain-containing protein [Elusimicrobiota bacterium]